MDKGNDSGIYYKIHEIKIILICYVRQLFSALKAEINKQQQQNIFNQKSLFFN